MKQQDYWNSVWSGVETESQPSDFCQKTIEELQLPVNSQILELACGRGHDTGLFLRNGYDVVAVDFAVEALKSVKEKLKPYIESKKLQIYLLDLDKEFPAQSAPFDLVYSHLGLHFFTLERTRELFKLIHGALKPQGWIAITVNSTKDINYGYGALLEPDLYMYNGLRRRFINKSFLEDMLGNQFWIRQLKEVDEHKPYGIRTRLHCFARKKQ